MVDRTAPKCQLRLEWVYGYRGHQVRSNLYRNASNEVIYFVAGVAIVYNVKERKQRFFLGHDDDIISLTLHPNNVLVATGQVGKSPQILIWNSNNLQTESIIKGGIVDGVGILAFDQKGELLASCSIDQDSTIIIWDWKRGKMLSKTNCHQEKVFDLKFNPYQENCVISCGVKSISSWKLKGNTLERKKGIFGQIKDMQTMFCLAFSKTKETIYAGTLNGSIYVWKDLKLEEIISDAHDGSVYCMVSCDDGFITAGKDGRVRLCNLEFAPLKIIDLKEKLQIDDIIIRSIFWHENEFLIGTQSSDIYLINQQEDVISICRGHAEGELWALATSSNNVDIFATASDDKTVRIWNMKFKELVKIKQLNKRIRSCGFSADGKHLACGLMDGSLTILNTETMEEVCNKPMRSEVLHELKYSPCGKYIAVGSNDNYVDILDSKTFKVLGTCKGSSSFITHVDWSSDSKYIHTNSGAKDNLVYRMPDGKHITNTEELNSIHNWHTFTGVLGKEVVGIWEKYTDKTDINATDAYFDGGCIVTGDDFGLVKLFRFPCLMKGSKFRKYVGHSSHVTNVRFNQDKTRVITVGGADHAIFQWRFITEDQADNMNSVENITKSRSIDISDKNASEVDVDLPEEYQAYMDSDSEESDSELSDREINSDVEKEKETTYDRLVYKEDLQILKPKVKAEIKKAETNLREKRQNTPQTSLSLKFVYGYRGYDCRDNIFWIQSTSEIIYHVAALGIVYNKQDNIQKFYNGHTDDILCLSSCKDKQRIIVATGQIGRDPPIHIWDAQSLETLSILKGEHYRGVCSLSFSNDGKKLASVGLDDYHTICVWEWKKGEKLATTRGHKDKIFSIKWNPHDSTKLVTVGVKHIKFWNQVGGGFTSNRGVFGKLSKVENLMCVTYGKTGDVCYTGVGNGSIYHWQNQKLIKVDKAHNGPVFAIFPLENYQGFVSGGKDGEIALWDEQFNAQLKRYSINKSVLSNNNKGVLFHENPSIKAICRSQNTIIVGTKNGEIIEIEKNGSMNIVIQGHGEGELWGLATHPKRLEICTASDDKSLRVWDVRTCTLVKMKVFDHLARSCDYSPDGKRIAVGMKDGTVLILDANSLEEQKRINNRNQEISDVKFSPREGKYLAVGSHDNMIDIYHVEHQKRVGICKGSSSYITHVDWDIEQKLLMVNSGAKELLFYEVPKGNRVNINSTEVFNQKWSTISGVLGSHLEGIWPPCTDITDINSTCVTKSQRFIATGDDFGFVKLFEFPCIGKYSKCKRYVGHSAHITRVRWTYDDSMLITIGGGDTTIMIWDISSNASNDISKTSIVNTNNQKTSSKKRGDSEESDTDSEYEGYDSDVKRENDIDYTKSMFVNPIKRPPPDMIKTIYDEAKAIDKSEKSKPRRTTKSKFSLTLLDANQANKKDMDAEQELNNDVPIKPKTEIKGLKLTQIHGYRAFDCRNNLFYIDDGTKIVYCAAGAGIVLDLNTKTQAFYLEHTDDIISLVVNGKYKNVVATGQIGITPVIHVWDTKTLETLSILSGLHKNGICSLDFSSSGKYLVSVGLDNYYTIGIWKWKEGTLIASHAGDLSEYRIFRAAFRPDSDSVFVTVGFKHIRFWTVAGSQLINKKGVLTDWSATGQKLRKMPTMLSIAFGLNNITYTGSANGDVFVWEDNTLKKVILEAHKGPIFTMYTTLTDGCIVTGAKEKMSKEGGHIKLWDKDMKTLRSFNVDNELTVVKSVCRNKNKLLVGTKNSEIYEINEKNGAIQKLVNGHSDGAIWGLSAHPDKHIFATASYDGYLKVWEIKTKNLLGTYKVGRPLRCLDFNKTGKYIAVGLKDGGIIILECSKNYTTFTVSDSKRERDACITNVKFSPNDSVLAVGSQDNSIDFFEFKSTKGSISRNGYCSQVPGEVSTIDWSNDSRYIKVSTGNYKNVIYEAQNGNEIRDTKIYENIVWNEWSSVFGEDVVGIWPADAKQDFINCAHLASHAMMLATGDDNGAIKLYKFPCIEKESEHELQYYGHSSNITNIKFTFDDSYLMSTGGEDFCIFVWECI